MSSDPTPFTPEQARERLERSRTPSLASARDRKIHAAGTAVLGLSIGFLMATQNLVTGAAGIALDFVFVAICLAVAFGVERAARTVPRRTKLWSRIGIGASFVLSLVLVLPWLNLQAQTEPNTWPVVIGATLVAALPSLLAAATIARRRP